MSLALWAWSSAGAAPGVDGVGVHAELLGDLLLGEHAAGAQPLAVAGQIVGVAQLDDDRWGEGPVHTGAVALLVELLGGLGVGVVVEQPVDLGQDLGWGLVVACQEFRALGMVRLVVWPPRKRTWR